MPICLCLLFLLVGENAYAGGWTQKAGAGLYIQNVTYYRSTGYFDGSGKKQPLGGAYSKYDINPYFEYGIHDWLTIGTNISAQRVSQNNGFGKPVQTSYGVGDSEFFVRTRLWHGNGFSFAAEPMIKIPSLKNNLVQPQIGSKNYDTGLTLSGGYCMKIFELNHFINLDAGYRHRFGLPNDQAKIAATAGISLTPKIVVMPQIFITSRLKSPKNPSFTQASGDDYNLNELRLSAVYKFDEKFSVQVGAFHNVAGKNIGSGNGLLFSVQKAF